jgi:hypothetical protein
MIVAPVRAQREAELRALLCSMNDAPGRLKPNNPVIPFEQFETLHVARLFIIDDKTLDDITAYGIPARTYPRTLALLGDVDGDADTFLEELANRSAKGLRTLFLHCEGFDAQTDVLQWMRSHRIPPAAAYVNWPGRTVRRVREEAALHEALDQHIQRNATPLKDSAPHEVHRTLRRLVSGDIAAGRLTLSPEGPTPLGWRLRNLFHLIGVPLLLLLALPVLIVVAPIFLIRLRRLEKSDAELCQRGDLEHSSELGRLEDHDVTNQFSAMGTLKPGFVRLWTTRFVLLIIDYAARHVYTRGRLARVRTIHFARWVFLDNRERVIFLSNYDGSLESYMDDFINKVGFGLNVVFSNGVGYPRTNWLILDGCRDERKFKEYLRRHQLPTQVWYKAYPGLTAVDLERNSRIRKGFESPSMTGEEAQEWVALL